MISFLLFIFIFGMCVSSPISVLFIKRPKIENAVDYRIGYRNIYYTVGGCLVTPRGWLTLCWELGLGHQLAIDPGVITSA